MEPFFTYDGINARYPNQYYLIDDETVQIEVTDSKGHKYYSFIDKEDFDRVSFCNWKIRKDSNTFYLCNSLHSFMHRIISQCPDGLTVDHIDGNGLNNRKSNLRNVTIGENSLNKRHMKMMHFDPVGQRYRVYWCQDGEQKSKSFHISTHGSEAEAKAKEFKEYITQEIYKRPSLPSNN